MFNSEIIETLKGLHKASGLCSCPICGTKNALVKQVEGAGFKKLDTGPAAVAITVQLLVDQLAKAQPHTRQDIIAHANRSLVKAAVTLAAKDKKPN